MFDTEDVILPDDFQPDTPQSEEPMEEPIAEPGELIPDAEDTKPAEVEEPQTEPEVPTPQTLKLKFNHEEREIPLEEAVMLAQKGMNYEKAVERARQEARDAYIAEQGYTWNGKPVTTESEYRQALMEQEIMEKYQGQVPDEIMQEIIESRRDREERAKEKEARAEQEKRDADFRAFFDYFKSVNERDFDPAKDQIPVEVRQAIEKGESLKVAYMEYHNKELRNQLKIAKKNAENAQKAPVGSVTANGGTKTEPTDPFIQGLMSDY